MPPLFAVLILFLGAAEPRHVDPRYPAHRRLETDRASGASIPGASEFDFGSNLNRIVGDNTGYIVPSVHELDDKPKRIARGAKKRDQQSPHGYRHPRPFDPDGFFTTPRDAQSNSTRDQGSRLASANNGAVLLLHNPLYPVTDSSYWAYAVMLLALVLFAVGIVGNLALMCIVWHNYYLKSAWNCILASLAFWDFLVLFFCLPVVIFNELTQRRLLGDLSCRMVPYMEVTSLGIATFSLCALSIDRFHVATSPLPKAPQVESCQSILAKLSVVWLGSMVLAAPELLLWQLSQEASVQPGGYVVDQCVRRPSPSLPESVYSLVLTYHEARMWWYFGCYFCLPLLFTLACQLVTRHVVAEEVRGNRGSGDGIVVGGKRVQPSSPSPSAASSPKKQRLTRERRLSSMVAALAAVYAACNLPENVCNIALAYLPNPVSTTTEALLALIGQLLLFVRCSATPVLFLCLCHSLGQAFMDCCCCCCDECHPDGASSSSSSASTTATAVSSSPSCLSSPSSATPPSCKKEQLKIVSGTTPVIYTDKQRDSSSVMALGTPC
ncbi:hypothetical protein DPEC_G00195020 [Dallia pectoralis]|uniref:Uncharacterized protein n=1 Tax=Dallia pectoralis TaxID=75939 RepID=A0ACC2G7J4_DALPE|nr:hypothetical protein DPEC_G00195020 [Dallia pectoralis]